MAAEDLLALTDAYTNKNDTFLRKLAGACIKMSTDIINEAPATANHTARMAWTDTVTSDCLEAARFGPLEHAIRNATIAANIDGAITGDIEFVVSEWINTNVKD